MSSQSAILYFILLLLISAVSAQSGQMEEKRSAMGGAAFGSLDRIPLSMLRKFYSKENKRSIPSNPNDYLQTVYARPSQDIYY